MNTEDRLLEAIQSGEVVKIIYHGGSQPGTLRDIAPISIKNGKVRARCLLSNTTKMFVVDKIEIAESEIHPEATEWQLGAEPSQQYDDISCLLNKKRDFLIGLGWHIEASPDSLSLHRCRKNGSPLKGSDVSLNYEEYTYDLMADEDGNLHKENWRKRQRPWTVRGKKQNSKALSGLDNAAATFLEWAYELAPAPKT